jgi:hypothetical protein
MTCNSRQQYSTVWYVTYICCCFLAIVFSYRFCHSLGPAVFTCLPSIAHALLSYIPIHNLLQGVSCINRKMDFTTSLPERVGKNSFYQLHYFALVSVAPGGRRKRSRVLMLSRHCRREEFGHRVGSHREKVESSCWAAASADKFATTRPNDNITKSGWPKPSRTNDNSTKYQLDQTTIRPDTN